MFEGRVSVHLCKLDCSRHVMMRTCAHQVLGFTMDKTQQVSDWSKRPLSEAQMLYAALDAHCLVQIRDRLCPKVLVCLRAREFLGMHRWFVQHWVRSASSLSIHITSVDVCVFVCVRVCVRV